MKKLLIIGYVWPEPESSAAGWRMMQLISFFLEKNFRICFATTASPTPFMADLEILGIQTESILLNNNSFDVFIKGLSPDIVLFDRFMMEEQFGWRVTQVCPLALKILDTEDLHFLRKARHKATIDGTGIKDLLFHSEIAKREVASIYRCDLSLIISETEMEILMKEFRVPYFILLYLPLIGDDHKPKNTLPSFNERKDFVSIGNFKHEPNWDAVLQLKKNIWPIIRKKLPRAEIRIYGAYPTQKVFQLNNPSEGFLILGKAASAREVIQEARVMLAPLRFGAGLKGKFIDSMAVGTPSVTTSIGAEAMSGEFSWGGYIENDPDDFATKAVKLYEDQVQWNSAQDNGFRILKERFASDLFRPVLWDKLDAIREDLEAHRKKNFTGSMLQHHRVNSTYFLSKYIEVKSRLLNIEDKKNTH